MEKMHTDVRVLKEYINQKFSIKWPHFLHSWTYCKSLPIKICSLVIHRVHLNCHRTMHNLKLPGTQFEII